MPKLYIELIDQLEAASAALGEAKSVIYDLYGPKDELVDQLIEARNVADRAAERLQERADEYGEMVHNGA
jgi:hypothetical protein